MINYVEHLFNAFKNSLNGLKYSVSEKAFQIEIFISLFVLPLCFYFIKNQIKLSILVSSFFLIFITELLNTGIEKTVDRISYKKHILSKKAKDIGSAAVLVSIINFVFVLCLLFNY